MASFLKALKASLLFLLGAGKSKSSKRKRKSRTKTSGARKSKKATARPSSKGIASRKTVSKKKIVSPKKPTSRKVSEPLKPALKKAAKPTGLAVGEITHYFPKAKAAVLTVKCDLLKLGDTLLIQGKNTNLKQKVYSMQINRIPIETAKRGEEIGIEVKKSVEVGDNIYKVG